MWSTLSSANPTLAQHHYLGAVKVGFAWCDEAGVIVLAHPRSRRLPLDWLELIRWCITSKETNAGSRQWGRMIRQLKVRCPEITTVVSYSDPSQGHTGALYRACNWWWAPTWHRLRPPPSGNGEWTAGKKQAVKDRWVYPLREDPRRVGLLTARDESILRRTPGFRYCEPGGVKYVRLGD